MGGCYNYIMEYSCNSSVIGGYCNKLCDNTCNSSIIGGNCNRLCNSCNSIIIGGNNLQIQDIDNTIFLNSTTNFRQTVEVSGSGTVSGPTFSIDFRDGAIKYIGSASNDFQVDFINVPSIPNTTITYTLIINQDVTPYMVTDVTVNTVSQTIKWANATPPDGNASQIDIVGLMFIFDVTGSIIQTLGQMGTFA